ncbi:DegT/DnrJ/EryC1/StrS family aminotransferase [candidate division KSB1 bacterium]
MPELAINGGEPIRDKKFPSWPVWGNEEKELINKVIDSGKWGYPNWKYVPEFEKSFAVYQDANYGVCFNSGTSALMGALWAAGVSPGDEVILPAYTFVATASAVLLLGAVPVFADIEDNTFHLDVKSVESFLTPKARAVMAVHIGGRSADMSALKDLCNRYELKLIEDAAQAWGAEWEHNRVGALGDAGIFSFQSSKNLTSAEGGIVLTNDKETADYLMAYVNCGRVEGKPKYEHYYLGGNFRLSDLNGSILMAQFKRYPEMHRQRRENAHILDEGLKKIEFITPVNEDDLATISGFHFYLIRYDPDLLEGISKFRIIEALQKEGIPAHPGYTIPLYRQPAFLNGAFGSRGKIVEKYMDYSKIFLPETECVCNEEGIWLSQTLLLGDEDDMHDIVNAFKKIRDNYKELM